MKRNGNKPSSRPARAGSDPTSGETQKSGHPGKRTLTMAVAASAPPSAPAVQRSPAPASTAGHPAEDWTNTVFRPDIYSGPASGANPPGQPSTAVTDVQRRSSADDRQMPVENDPDRVRAIAAQGVSGSGSSLPHGDRIARSFGAYASNLDGVSAHIGGEAGHSASLIGARAYATGNQLAFQTAPDVHTAAHEAAHVVQQQHGVQLTGGVGSSGDVYEEQADAVADAVVRGESAEAILAGDSAGTDQMAGTSAGSAAPVQRIDAVVASDPETDQRRRAASSMGRSDYEANGYYYWNAEMDRVSRHTPGMRRRIDAYSEAVEDQDIATELPQPLPAYVGYTTYYRARHDDFVRRNGDRAAPPYYLDYGEKYANRFTQVLFPKLSGQGKHWLVRARLLLQLAIENRLLRDPPAFAELERDHDAFQRFCYDSHPNAYLDAGLRYLPMSDHIQIATTPDLGDLFTIDGLRQVGVVVPDIIGGYGDAIEDSADSFLDNLYRFFTDPRVHMP
ncbi:MAG: DUF4157 domain-containing protein [Proteobacteria bacterium]|nr:DUF4157 domain-containing protein [Pseudomonadota bacterium]